MPADEETSSTGTTSSRSMHLLGSRRVTVKDLLDAGLLPAGAKLRFDRTRIGTTYGATVTEEGCIRLDRDGEEFRSPSRAAMVAAGMRGVDGWRAWSVTDQNRLLDAVRQELLDQAISHAAGTAHRRTEGPDRRRIHDMLREARRHAEAGTPDRMSVRELLRYWGAEDRGDQVSRIEADLENHGLRTSPKFSAVTLDMIVALTTPPDEAEPDPTSEPQGVEDVRVAEDRDGDDDLNVRLTVGNLAPLEGVVSVAHDAPIEEATTKMLLNEFSQLAVLNGPRKLRGAVTWRSIAQALQQNARATVDNAIDPRVDAVDYDRDLFEVLPAIQRNQFVFVLDDDKKVNGIVTTADVAQHYGDMATPFFQLGEMDQTLRWIVGRTLEIETLQKVCRRRIGSIDDLSFGDYQRVLEDADVWTKLGWPLDRVSFVARLEKIRQIRNKVMHFHSDPIPEGTVDQLRQFNKLLHHYRYLQQSG